MAAAIGTESGRQYAKRSVLKGRATEEKEGGEWSCFHMSLMLEDGLISSVTKKKKYSFVLQFVTFITSLLHKQDSLKITIFFLTNNKRTPFI